MATATTKVQIAEPAKTDAAFAADTAGAHEVGAASLTRSRAVALTTRTTAAVAAAVHVAIETSQPARSTICRRSGRRRQSC